MTVIPSQKLSTSDFLISVAAGLMLFLLPNDARSQFDSDQICISYVFLISFVIVAVMFFIIKRYEAIGCALFSFAVLETVSVVYEIIVGSVNRGSKYWYQMSEYNIICIFLLWVIPFMFAVCFRLLTVSGGDTNEMRQGFANFMIWSMRSLMIIYIIVLLFKLTIPVKPHTEDERSMELMLFQRIGACITGEHENGIEYIIWHSIIFAPFAFYLSVLVPKLRVLHVVIVALSLGITVEALQFSLNTSTACTDDIIMYIIGAVLGIMIKYFINFLRDIITDGEDKCMLSFEYTHKNKRNKDEPEILTED